MWGIDRDTLDWVGRACVARVGSGLEFINMGSLDRKTIPQDATDLKTMVDSLQVALFNHKQQIANEIRNSLASDLSIAISNSYQSLSENYSLSMFNLEKFVKLELQSLTFKVQSIESKSAEILNKIQSLESAISSNSQFFSGNLQKNREKTIVLEQQTLNFQEKLGKIEENYSGLKEDLWNIREALGSDMKMLENDLKSAVRENKNELQGFKFEILGKLQDGLFKVSERVNESRRFGEMDGVRNMACLSSGGGGKDLIEYVNSSMMSIGSLRIRVEKLEISEQICEEFRKNRQNR